MEDLPFAPTNLTAILADLVFVLVLAGGPLLLRWARVLQVSALTYYRTHTSVGERAVLGGLAQDAAAWAERFAQSPEAEAKLKEAVAMVQAALKRRGIQLDIAEIEAAVVAGISDLEHRSRSGS